MKPMTEDKWQQLLEAAMHVPEDWRALKGCDSIVAGDYAEEGEPDLLINVELAEHSLYVKRLIASAPAMVEEIKRLKEELQASEAAILVFARAMTEDGNTR